jgi:SAM-dependent methyltransferase
VDTASGIDSNPNLLATARARAQAAGHTNITFLPGDLREVTFEEDFDAVVGRLILCHLQDPAAVLRRMAGSLRPGGVAAFYELDFTVDAFSEPLVPLHQQACAWIKQACAKAGINIAMGRQLHQTFVAAGFEPPRIRVDGVAGGSRAFVEAFTVLAAETIRMLLPLLVKSGIATEHEVGVDAGGTLARPGPGDGQPDLWLSVHGRVGTSGAELSRGGRDPAWSERDACPAISASSMARWLRLLCSSIQRRTSACFSSTAMMDAPECCVWSGSAPARAWSR